MIYGSNYDTSLKSYKESNFNPFSHNMTVSAEMNNSIPLSFYAMISYGWFIVLSQTFSLSLTLFYIHQHLLCVFFYHHFFIYIVINCV